MKFTEKYEILELLTSGRVSTFLTRERATLSQAIVHTFECPANFAVEFQNSSILKHFDSLAPSPAEPVTEVGFDEGCSSAYVVTKVPPPVALQSWVRAYCAFPGGTRSGGERKGVGTLDENAAIEISASEAARPSRQSGRPKPQRLPEVPSPISTEPFAFSPLAASAQQQGEFTMLFENLGAFQRLSGRGTPVPAEPSSTSQRENPTNLPTSFPTNSSVPDPPSKGKPASREPDLPEPSLPESKPGSFTQEFSSGMDDPSDPPGFGSVRAPEPPGAKEPGAFTDEFLAISGKSTKPGADEWTNWEGRPAKNPQQAPMFSSMPKAVSPASKSPAEGFDSGPEGLKSSTGEEFSSFFRGPFEPPGPPAKPVEYSDPVQASPPPRVGDFTQMFGPETRLEAKNPPSRRPPEPPPAIPQFSSEGAKEGVGAGDPRLDIDFYPSDALKPSIGSTANPSQPAMFSGTASPVSRGGGGFASSDARRDPSGGENAFLNQSGRSDATNVFKPRGVDAPLVEPDAPSGPSDFTMFISRSQLKATLPPESANPAVPNPALPMPPMPSYAPPVPPPLPPAPMPQLAVPQPPPVPRPSAPPPRAASYWPLITVLTVLFAIAALMIMYFALKH